VDPGPDISTPEQLARECQAGSREAFAALVDRFHARIYTFLLKLTGQPPDAEDLTQETFLKAWLAIERFDRRFTFATWLFTIAKRTAYNHLRSRRPAADASEVPEPADASDPASVLSRAEEVNELWRLARTLKPNQYQVLWLRYGEGFSVAEAAKIMGVHPVHAKVLLHRGRGQLAKLLKARPEGADCGGLVNEIST
jgi:RNA polymerase sigma-70 factor (ECF subfamily)